MTSIRKYVPVRSSHETNLGTTLNMGAIGIEMYTYMKGSQRRSVMIYFPDIT